MEQGKLFDRQKIISFLKKNIAWILLVIVLLVSGIGGKKGYDMLQEQHERYIDSLNRIKIKREDSLSKVIVEERRYLDEVLNKKEQTYYDDFIRERSKRIRAEKQLRDIRYRIYDRDYLDSLAANIRFQ